MDKHLFILLYYFTFISNYYLHNLYNHNEAQKWYLVYIVNYKTGKSVSNYKLNNFNASFKMGEKIPQ